MKAAVKYVVGEQYLLIDLVMWTKNGAFTLPTVLKRIDRVIPDDSVAQRIIVDDKSSDNTRKIARSFGWDVLFNEGGGISNGANTALKHVSSEYFVSFEQDLLLNAAWWKKISREMTDPKVAVVSGIRFADRPQGVKKLQQYVAKKYKGEKELAPWLKSRQMSAFTLGKTLDNTIYKTRIIREIGGFPKTQLNAGVDTLLAYAIDAAGYQWIVDYNVQSTHLRTSLREELNHQQWYASMLYEIWGEIETKSNQPPPVTRFDVIYRCVIGPFTGMFMAVKMKEPSIAYIHPLIRLYYLRGFLTASKPSS